MARLTALGGEFRSCKVEWCAEVAAKLGAQGRCHAWIDGVLLLQRTCARISITGIDEV